MTSTPIGDMSNLFGAINSVNDYSKLTANKTQNMDAFSDIMTTVSSTKVPEAKPSNTVTDSQRPNDTSKDSSATTKMSSDDNKDAAIGDSKDESTVVSKTENLKEADLKDEAKELSEDILNEVADKLDIPVDELEEILEQMGLCALDLINPQNVSMLVANVLGDGDMMSLVTVEGLSDIVMDINADITELVSNEADSLGIPVQDFTELMGNIDLADEDILPQDMVADVTLFDNESSVGNVVSVFDETKDKSTIIQEDNTKASEITNAIDTSDAYIASANAQEEMSSSDSENLMQNGSFKENVPGDERIKAREDKADTLDAPAATIINQVDTASASPEAVNTDADLMPEVDMQQMINDITENMKLMQRQDITELEMQLNPASLGNIHISIASKDGNISAQLEAQNEAVKAALELQIMELKENLEAQGVKVTAVEVTVSSHEFEQNLEQGNDSSDQMADEQERLRKATRRLNISELFADDNIEGLDDEEVITAKMMAADGNQMDYRA